MIICGNKGQAVANLIDWFRNLTDAELITFILSLVISIVISIVTCGLIRSTIISNIEKKYSLPEVVFMPISIYICPTLAFIFSFAFCLIATGIVDLYSPFLFCLIFFVLTILIVCLMPKYSPFSVLRNKKNYYISRSWFGNDYIPLLSESVKIEDSEIGIRVFVKKKNFGIISKPVNLPWLKSRQYKYNKFKTFIWQNK